MAATFEKMILVSTEEFAQSFQYKELLRLTNPSITTVSKSGKLKSCLASSSIWIIDFGATDHMTGNFSFLYAFQSYTSSSSVTLADESATCVMGFGIANPTPSISLSSVLCLP